MVSVLLRKTGKKDPHKEYALMVRDYNGIEVDWTTLAYMDYFSASRIEGESISYWDGDAEEKPEASALRLEHPSLREAWENYQTLKTLFTKNK
jgi:hypothetical protein